jgi:tetratricopeptide (TPR) repeat protein
MVLTFAVLALLSAVMLGQAQAAEPVDAAQAERAELAHMLQDASDYIWLLDDEASALPLLTEVARRAQAIGDTDTLAAALTERSTALELLGDLRGAIDTLQEATPLFCTSALPSNRTQCAGKKLDVGRLMARVGDAEAIPQLEEAARQAQADADHGVEITALNALGEAFWARDSLEDAKRSHERALTLALRLNTVHEQRVARLTTHGGQEKGPQTIHDELGLTSRSVIVREHGAALVGLGRVAMDRGDLIQATAQHEAALGLLGRLRAEWERGVWPRETTLDRVSGDSSVQHTEAAIEALALYELSRVWSLQGRLEEAVTALNRALPLFGETFDSWRQADVMMALGALALDNGQVAEAEQLYRKALTLKTEVADARGKMWALISLGSTLALQSRGRVEAKERLDEAHALALSIGSRSGEAAALRGLGTVSLKQHNDAKAADMYQAAVTIYAELGIPHGQVKALLDLASAQFELVEPQDMVQSCEQALMIATRHGLQPLVNLARIQLTEALRFRSAELWLQRDLPQAEAVWRQSIEIAAQTGDPTLVSTGYTVLGDLLAQQGRLVEAEAAYIKAVELLTVTDEQYFLPFVWLSLADIAVAQGRLPEAEGHMRRAVEGLAEGLDKPGVEPIRVAALLNLAELQSDLGWVEEAERTYKTSVTVGASVPYPGTEVEARVLTATFLVGQGKHRAARATLEPCRTRAQSSERKTERVELEIACLAAMSEAQRSPRAAKRSALQIVAVAEAASDVLWQASTLIHLARAHLRLGQTDEAEAALLLAIRKADRSRDPAQQAEALTLLAELLHARGETAEAEAARAAAAAR